MHVRAAALPDDRPSIVDLLIRVASVDGYPPLSEEAAVLFESTAGPAGWVAESDGRVIAFAHHRTHRDTAIVEIAAERGNAAESVAMLVPVVTSAGLGTVHVWASDPVATTALLDSGASVRRRLVRLERGLPAEATPTMAEGVRIASFRCGVDEGAYLIVANDAFAGHPESSAWTRHTFDERASRPWFDPDGLFMAWDRGRPVGTCWTKVHSGGAGEIYSIAVRPSAGGRGVGRALVLRGFDYLADRRGIGIGMLWADLANEAAVRMYTRLGMAVVRERTELLLES